MIQTQYYQWLCDLIFSTGRRRYKRLLKFLYGVEFTYIIDFDENRLEDGLSLRYRFGDVIGYSDEFVSAMFVDTPCSLLEVMIALSIRCEEHIMDDPDVGNRTAKWFWGMIDNSGLGQLTDDIFSIRKAEPIVDTILNRTYSPCGEGGLFSTQDCDQDFRTIELWYQLMIYLNEYMEEDEIYEGG